MESFGLISNSETKLDPNNEIIMYKIIQDQASEEEIKEWSNNCEIEENELERVIKLLKDTYKIGEELGSSLFDSNDNGKNNEKILAELNDISSQLETLISQVNNLIKELE